ncbi:MAG: TrkA family potassium uptake protein [Planctomycetes bacterium]|nr:TrkA family potassium uptake protein [Planctomycetota bacterium]
MKEELEKRGPLQAFIVVVGCGHFGAYLAGRLSRSGHAVVSIDRDAAAFTALCPEFGGVCVVGDCLREPVLEETGITHADIVLAVTSDDDFNLAVGLVCRKVFCVGAVAVRVQDMAYAGAYREVGIETVCPEQLGVSSFIRRVEGRPEAGQGVAPGRSTRQQEEQPEHMRSSLFIVVVGCGRLGSHLASQLSRSGHSVVVIDREPSSFAALSAETFSGFCVEGDASEPAVLRRAKIDQADLVIAATSEDNLNLMVALVAKRVFGVKRVTARVYDPKREAIYGELGLETVCPTIIATEAFSRIVERSLEARRSSHR